MVLYGLRSNIQFLFNSDLAMLIFTEKVAITYSLDESKLQNLTSFISIYAKTYFTLGDCKKISNSSDYKISKPTFFGLLTKSTVKLSFLRKIIQQKTSPILFYRVKQVQKSRESATRHSCEVWTHLQALMNKITTMATFLLKNCSISMENLPILPVI